MRALGILCVVCGLCACGAEAGGNLLTNPAFRAADGIRPEGWTLKTGKGLEGAYTSTGGVLRISQGPAAYLHAVSQTFAIPTNVTYWFEVDVLCDALDGLANVHYAHVDAAGKTVPGKKPLFFPFYCGPEKKWKRAAVPIPAADVGRDWRKLKIEFLVYNKSRRPADDKAIYFRNPSITRFAGQKNVPMNGGGPRRVQRLAPQPFAALSAGAYHLENGGVGHLNLRSTRVPRNRPGKLRVTAPSGVAFELHGRVAGNPKLVYQAPAADGTYALDAKLNWPLGAWLLLSADATAPTNLTVTLTLTVDGVTARTDVPVVRFDGPPPGALPKTRRFSGYQGAPLALMDESAFAHPLARGLRDYWRRAGYTDVTTFNFTGILHYRQTMATPFAAEGVGVDGAPIGTPCDSDIVRRGVTNLVARFEQAKAVEKIKSAEYTMWDYEPYVLGPVTVGCFCERCRAAFARDRKFASVPDARTILKDHENAWVAFRCRQRAETVKTVVAALKAINPRTKFGLCTMPCAPDDDPLDYWRTYGIDLPLYRDFVDVFRSMNYGISAGVFRSVEKEMQLGKPVETLFENGWGNEPRDGRIVAQHVLAGLFAGMELPFIAVGMSLAEGDELAHLREALQFVAATENDWSAAKPLYGADKCHLTVLEPELARVAYALERRRADGTRFVLVLNTSRMKPVTVIVRADAATSQTVRLPVSGWRLITLHKERNAKWCAKQSLAELVE